MRKMTGTGLCLIALVALAGCSGSQQEAAEAVPEEVKRATAYIDPKSGSELNGTAIFINEGSQVALQVSIENAPEGVHACHIHEIGDCSADDGKSAGGHWNPMAHDHGKWEDGTFHLGDIGNVVVGADGKGTIMLTTDRWSMGGPGDNNVMGKSIIINVDQTLSFSQIDSLLPALMKNSHLWSEAPTRLSCRRVTLV